MLACLVRAMMAVSAVLTLSAPLPAGAPTATESELPGFEAELFYGLLAPVLIRKLNLKID